MELSNLISQLKSEEKSLLLKVYQIKRAILKLRQLSQQTKRRTLSVDARRRIATAQKKRWADWKRKQKK
jgi:hypothetical protein